MKNLAALLYLIPLIMLSGCINSWHVGSGSSVAPLCKAPYNAGNFQSGDGSADSPYVICNFNQFNHLVTFCDATAPDDCLNINFILGSNLDLNGEAFTPLDNFRGVFDGNNKIISNWSYAAADSGDNAVTIELDIGNPTPHVDFHLGLFRTLDSGAVIKNLTLENVSIKGRYNTGAFAGQMLTGSSMSNVHSKTSGSLADVDTALSGVIIGFNDITTGGGGSTGGIVGFIQVGASVSNASFNGIIRGPCYVGGISGLSNGGIAGSHSVGALSGRDCKSGGLSGEVSGAGSTVADSYSTMAITQTGTVSGGLIGQMSGGAVMTKSYFNGSVTGTIGVGGLVGFFGDAGSSISKCYAIGTADGVVGVGGAIGWLDNWAGGALVEDSFARVNVSYTQAAAQWGQNGGGGGFAGVLGSHGGPATTVSRVYAVGTITDNSPGGVATNKGDIVGGINAMGVLEDSFALETNTADGFVGFTNAGTVTNSTPQAAAAMKTSALYTAEGWDFVSVWKIQAGVNGGYPQLR